jgi:hypothetical protein
VTEADRLAVESGLLGYASGEWLTDFVALADNATLPSTPPHTSGVEVVWSYTAGEPCPADGQHDRGIRHHSSDA